MTTINYDKPVKDLIAQLDATNHVTHKAYQKTSVTLHHNGGRLSHEGVLRVWKTRPASAHFDVDGQGILAQYVRVNEYAWAAGNQIGNQRSIHIEMANELLSPTWRVSEVTWKSAARLAGWLFARVIGARPTMSNLFPHHHWSSTLCAGPSMDAVWPAVLLEVQHWYGVFTTPTAPGGSKSPSHPPVLHPPTQLLRIGSTGEAVKTIQQFLHNTFPAYKDSVTYMRGRALTVDGSYGQQTATWVVEFQHRVGILSDGVVGPQTRAQMKKFGFRG